MSAGEMTEQEFDELMNATLQGPVPATTVQRLCALTSRLLDEREEVEGRERRFAEAARTLLASHGELKAALKESDKAHGVGA